VIFEEVANRLRRLLLNTVYFIKDGGGYATDFYLGGLSDKVGFYEASEP
jgi:hypothetical protein